MHTDGDGEAFVLKMLSTLNSFRDAYQNYRHLSPEMFPVSCGWRPSEFNCSGCSGLEAIGFGIILVAQDRRCLLWQHSRISFKVPLCLSTLLSLMLPYGTLDGESHLLFKEVEESSAFIVGQAWGLRNEDDWKDIFQKVHFKKSQEEVEEQSRFLSVVSSGKPAMVLACPMSVCIQICKLA